MEAKRMQNLGSAVFTQLDGLCKQAVAKGTDIINLSIGSPDLPPAPHIIAALQKAIAEPQSYGYALSRGLPEFLAAVASWYTKFNVQLDPATEIHSLMGSQDGLAHLALCFINPGDVVLVPDPGYPIFSTGALIAGADLRYMPLSKQNGYLPDFSSLDEDTLRRAKLMILNYPNNPLAATAPRSFFVDAIALAKRYNIIICHDFAYSELVFDGYQPDSILSIEGAKDVAIEFHSLSKVYNMAGCRIAFVVGNKNVIASLGRLKSNFDYGVFKPVQMAAIAALTGSQACVYETAKIYQNRRDILVNGFNAMGWQVESPKASMYLWLPVPTKQTSFEFATDLLATTGVVATPGVAFGEQGEGYVRIALVQPDSRLHEVVERVGKWLGN